MEQQNNFEDLKKDVAELKAFVFTQLKNKKPKEYAKLMNEINQEAQK